MVNIFERHFERVCFCKQKSVTKSVSKIPGIQKCEEHASKFYQWQAKVKTAPITVFKSKVMWNLPLNHFDPGLTALIAYRVFIMEKQNAGKDNVSTDGAEHFQVVNMFQVVSGFFKYRTLVTRLFGDRIIKTTGSDRIHRERKDLSFILSVFQCLNNLL